MRELLRDYLDGNLSRRGFLTQLVAAGFTAGAAGSIIEAADEGTKPAPDGIRARIVTGTGGDLLVEQAKAAGAKYVFTNPGSFEVGFFDALTDRPELQVIVGLHEGIVIPMADGYHKVTQEPALVNVHAIAGTAQMAGQLYNAHRDGSAIVVTAGMLDSSNYSDDVLLAPRPGFSQADVNRQFTKISWEVRNGRVHSGRHPESVQDCRDCSGRTGLCLLFQLGAGGARLEGRNLAPRNLHDPGAAAPGERPGRKTCALVD